MTITSKLQKLNTFIRSIMDESIRLSNDHEKFSLIKELPQSILSVHAMEQLSLYYTGLRNYLNYSSGIVIPIILRLGINLFVLMNKLHIMKYHCLCNLKLSECIYVMWLFIEAFHISSMSIIAGIELYLDRLLNCNNMNLSEMVDYDICSIAFVCCFLPILMLDDTYPPIDGFCYQFSMRREDLIYIEMYIIKNISLNISSDDYFEKMMILFHVPVMIESNTLDYLDLQSELFILKPSHFICAY